MYLSFEPADSRAASIAGSFQSMPMTIFSRPARRVSEKARPAIGIDKNFADDLAGDKIKERPGNEIVGLRERARHSRSAQGPVFPIGQTGGPKFFQCFIDGRNRDRATFDIHDVTTVLFKKSDFTFLRVNGDPVSKCIRALQKPMVGETSTSVIRPILSRSWTTWRRFNSS